MSVRVIYKDIAPNAAEDASVSASGYDSKSNLALLPFGADNPTEYATLESNLWALDGSFKIYDNGYISFWSNDLSDDSGEFATSPTITIEFTSQYTSLGISFNFMGDSWCNDLDIAWYQSGTVLDTKNFHPNGFTYYCENTVEHYDKLVITFNKTSLPYRRVKLDKIVFGIERIFNRDELRRVRLTEEIDATGREVPANAMDWTLSSKEDVSYIFQFKQPVYAYDGNHLFGVFYVDKADKKDDGLYNVVCTDAVGVMDTDSWADAYYSDVSAKTLIETICNGYNVAIDDSLLTKTVKGIIRGETKREALQQVCFAIGAVADTSNGDAIRVFPIVSDTAKNIPDSRTRTGGVVKEERPVTEVRLTAHSYSTTASSDAEAIKIGNVTYYDTKTVYTIVNPDTTASDRPKVIKVEDATLVTPDNVEEIAQILYDQSMRQTVHSLKFRVVDEAMGDYVQTTTPWGEVITGHYTHASVTLSGFALSDAEVLAE